MKNPDEYTPVEKVFLLNHPAETASLLDKFSGFQAIAKIIKHFHENYDGSGTSDSLKHNEIPIGSRIIAVADIFDNYVYRRKGNSLHESLQLIEKKVSVRLDAKIVYYLHKYANTYPVNDFQKARQVKLFDLEPGMELAAGIYTQRGAKLLPMDTILRKDSIIQLAQYARSEALEENVFIK
jgi:HD-GYP domain-containing protein (c-di-GMP phosphodiesterase class II)